MNKLTQTLLGGVAFGALAVAPALAEQKPMIHFIALHGGRVVNKTKMHNHGATHITYTFGVYSYASLASAYRQKIHLQQTYYLFSYSSGCPPTRMHVRVDQKKTTYGKTSVGTETYSLGCPSGPTTFHGMDYKITDPNAEGQTDNAKVTFDVKFTNDGTRYKAKVNMDVSITIVK